MKRRPVLVLATILTLAGGGLFLYKVFGLGFPLTAASTTDVWTVEARISFEGGAGSVKVSLEIPHAHSGFYCAAGELRLSGVWLRDPLYGHGANGSVGGAPRGRAPDDLLSRNGLPRSAPK